jgi:hypothetical protein
MKGKPSPILAVLVFSAALGAQACVVYEPVPVAAPPVSRFDRVWDASIRAAEETGIRIVSADRATGTIRGVKDPIDVTITLFRQADGSTRMELNLAGQLDRDPTLADRFRRAYDRHMGR